MPSSTRSPSSGGSSKAPWRANLANASRASMPWPRLPKGSAYCAYVDTTVKLYERLAKMNKPFLFMPIQACRPSGKRLPIRAIAGIVLLLSRPSLSMRQRICRRETAPRRRLRRMLSQMRLSCKKLVGGICVA